MSVPAQALQGLRGLLPPEDLRAARLVCRVWAEELGVAVTTVALPPALWQGSLPCDGQRAREAQFAGVKAALLGDADSDVDTPPAILAARAHAVSPFQAPAAAATAPAPPPAQSAERAAQQARDRAARLAQLAAAFPAARGALLEADAARGVDGAVAAAALGGLGRLRGVRALALLRLSGDAPWAAALGALLAPDPVAAAGAATFACDAGSGGSGALGGGARLAARLTELRFLEASLPGPAGLAPLQRAAAPGGPLAALRSLELSVAGGARLARQHVAALGAMAGLTRLALVFRAGEGGWAAPLVLDPLCGLQQLEELKIEFTGFEEIGRNVVFSSTAPLARLRRLRVLRLLRLSALADGRGLEGAAALREVQLLGLDPLPEELIRSLGRCAQLTHLDAAPVAPSALPLLGGLASVRCLTLGIHDPGAAGAAAARAAERSLPAPGAAAAAAIGGLPALRSLSLSGPVALCAHDLAALSRAGGGRLEALALRVALPDGTVGLSRFGASLARLSLAPFARRAGPIRVLPAELPPALEVLEGEALAFPAAPGAAPLAPAATLRRLALRPGGGGVGGFRGAAAPDLGRLVRLTDLEIWSPAGLDARLFGSLAASPCAARLRRLSLRCCAPEARPAAASRSALVDSEPDEDGGIGGGGAAAAAGGGSGGITSAFAAAAAAAAAEAAAGGGGARELLGRVARGVGERFASLAAALSSGAPGADGPGAAPPAAAPAPAPAPAPGGDASSAAVAAAAAASAAAAMAMAAPPPPGPAGGALGGAIGDGLASAASFMADLAFGAAAGIELCAVGDEEDGDYGSDDEDDDPAAARLELEADDSSLLGASAAASAARAAVRGAPELACLALTVSTRRAAADMEALGTELASWLAPPRTGGGGGAGGGWRELRVALRGPGAYGSGAALAARRLAEALPRCRFGPAPAW
ncbi:hypothetical protein Rsub_02190 [Raphidocelis subcapitata]|uniref:Uncharacterized protein n=1 Tax=Raphidocelis subcapitata TaxID=307507 RepID=A0A2V0NUT7_9CHLO|nr:hypothetical protein Rsub_02190 [Raphidocelis subcapitata]|eukprot:GBF89313.1 hypothetical protein Rsub_02190 [Raphidocelis subcapitata]